jgi:hypothetical protein
MAKPSEQSESKTGHRWAKGQSGNPGGRPKEAQEVKELARQYTGEAILKLADWMRSDNAKASVAACNVLLDRGWGKAIQAITGEDGGAIKIEVVKFSE